MSAFHNPYQFFMTLKRIILIFACAFLPFTLAEAQTQLEINSAAQNEFELSEQKMDSVFAAILVEYENAPEFISSLKKAQEAWIIFRDAHLESIYPEKDKRAYYGSVYPFCSSNILTQLNKQRTEQLKTWLKGTEEGDMCAGSVKICL